MKLELNPYLKQSKPLNDQFNDWMSFDGERFREVPTRKTFKMPWKEKSIFVKQHQGITWKEIFKNLLQGKLPIISAKTEMKALKRCQKNNIPVPILLGWGEAGILPAYKDSFLVTEELENIIGLDRVLQDWKTFSFHKKITLIKQIADLTRQLHDAGVNHRDYYLCHLMLCSKTQRLFVMDLHRAMCWEDKPSKRWIIKDLSGLYYSALDLQLNTKDFMRFIRYYRKISSIKDLKRQEKCFWLKISKKAYYLHEKSRT